MRQFDDYDSGRKVYVGRDLDPDTTSDRIRDLFRGYGPIKAVWIARNPPGFAYVTFEDAKDASLACKDLNGSEWNGRRLRVEVAHGPRVARDGRFGGKAPRSSGSPSFYRRSPSYGAATGRLERSADGSLPRRGVRCSPSVTRRASAVRREYGRGRARSFSPPSSDGGQRGRSRSRGAREVRRRSGEASRREDEEMIAGDAHYARGAPRRASRSPVSCSRRRARRRSP